MEPAKQSALAWKLQLLDGPFAYAFEGLNALQNHAINLSFTVPMSFLSTSMSKANIGAMVRKNYRCHRGHSPNPKGMSLREKPSTGTNCPFRAQVVLHKRKGGIWFVTITNHAHNHPLDPESSRAGNRQW
jgi:hypothetical protein